MAAYTIPLATALSIYSSGWLTFSTVIFAFIIIPVTEILVGKDKKNLKMEEAEKKRHNSLFDLMLYLNLPIVFGLLYWALIKVSTENYYIFEMIGICFSTGILLATNAINVAHELGKTYVFCPIYEQTPIYAVSVHAFLY